MGFGSIYGFCAKPLLLGMNWLHDVTKLGYGWTIVLITIILRGMFWPLTAASTRSMKRMQALAPEMNALKGKYKDDMQKFTQKQWELYRKHKVNPMSGCLPMLIQMPVFFGFLRFFYDDSQRDRTAWRAFSMGGRFVEARHAVHDSGHPFSVQPAAAADGRRDVMAIAPGASLAGHGSIAGKNDARNHEQRVWLRQICRP